jgi:hypothetical protein
MSDHKTDTLAEDCERRIEHAVVAVYLDTRAIRRLPRLVPPSSPVEMSTPDDFARKVVSAMHFGRP